ncbi:MAG: ParA family protein [Deltaproteobacteria bacterium]|nr:ParA family protein [Deltaproteobacteria bacterium]
MRRVVFNQKGGVGKSSITCNLAAISAARGFKTLVVDLDSQANASQYLLGRNSKRVTTSVADFFEASLGFSLLKPKAKSFVVETRFPNLHLVASSPALADMQQRLEQKHKIYKLREMLDDLAEYDAVFIDTPPALNFFTLSALIASDGCIIPFDCDPFAKDAIERLMESVREIRADHNRGLRVEGIVVNQYSPSAKLPKRLVKELREDGLPVFGTYLSASIKMRESHDRAEPLIHMDPKHKLSKEFVKLYDELLHVA